MLKAHDVDDELEEIQKQLKEAGPSTIRENLNEVRFKEERTGLLSNEVHLDKYPQETRHELELMEKQKASPEHDNF